MLTESEWAWLKVCVRMGARGLQSVPSSAPVLHALQDQGLTRQQKLSGLWFATEHGVSTLRMRAVNLALASAKGAAAAKRVSGRFRS